MSPGWAATSASRRGSIHERTGAPNQDAHRSGTVGDTAFAVVADGHGHPRYLRSDIGAELAADLAAEILPACLARISSELATDPAHSIDGLAEALAQLVVTEWRAAVAQHLAEYPLAAASEAEAISTYGTTLLALTANRTHLLAFRIGDGDLALVDPAGSTTRLFPDEPDHDGVHTHSLAEPDPARSARVTVIELAQQPVALAFVVTDGFGAPQVEPRWWERVGVELLHHAQTHGITWVSEKLPGWLAEPAEVGGDDTSLAVLAARGSDQL